MLFDVPITEDKPHRTLNLRAEYLRPDIPVATCTAKCYEVLNVEMKSMMDASNKKRQELHNNSLKSWGEVIGSFSRISEEETKSLAKYKVTDTPDSIRGDIKTFVEKTQEELRGMLVYKATRALSRR